MTLKKNKENEKVFEPNEELMHVDLHSMEESNMVGDSLWVLLLNNQPKRGKKGETSL
jgi:hypothetical protein